MAKAIRARSAQHLCSPVIHSSRSPIMPARERASYLLIPVFVGKARRSHFACVNPGTLAQMSLVDVLAEPTIVISVFHRSFDEAFEGSPKSSSPASVRRVVAVRRRSRCRFALSGCLLVYSWRTRDNLTLCPLCPLQWNLTLIFLVCVPSVLLRICSLVTEATGESTESMRAL